MILKPFSSEVKPIVDLISRSMFKEALEEVTVLSLSFPEDPTLLNIIGACRAGLGQLDFAVSSYKKAILIKPDYAKAHFNLGVAYHDLLQYENSINYYNQSITIDPNYAEAHNNLGNVLRDTGHFDEAIDSYKRALNINPDYFEVHYSLAITYEDLGDFNSMMSHLDNVLKINPNLAEAHNKLGVGLIELNKLDDAVKSYQKALEINPNFSEAYNNLGNTFKELNQLNEAVTSYKKALEINPDYPALHNNLGNAYKELGKLSEAVDSYNHALEHNEDYPDSLNNLGTVLHELGKFDEAIINFEKLLLIDPNHIDANYNAAIVQKDMGRLDDALISYQKIIELDSNNAEVHNNLGNIYKDLNQLDDALKSFNRAIEIKPKFAEAYNNLGNLYIDFIKVDDAIDCYKRAIDIDPSFIEAHNNIGNVFKDIGKTDEAINSYKKAIELKYDFAEAHNNLGAAYKDLNNFNEALNSFENALKLRPSFAEARHNLGNVYRDLNNFDGAIKNYIQALNINVDLEYALGNLLGTKMNSCNWDDLTTLLDDLKIKLNNHQKVIDPFTILGLIDDPFLQKRVCEIRVNNHQPRSNLLPPINFLPKKSKIRIGYFSPDFREHPLAYLTAELYELHDRGHFEIHAFSFGKDTNDEMNLRIKAGVDYFHNVGSMSHKEITLFVRSLEIEIAVDLAGFTAGAKTEIFSMTAAPIQLSYIGYLGTMGADYYDYLIADPIVIPKKNLKYFAEKVVYLPSYQVNDSTDHPPKVELTRKEVGLPEKGFVFCCFNNTWKITPIIFDSWARILKKVEGSVLIIYANNNFSMVNLTKEIVKRGIDSNRLIFGGTLERSEYLARYRTADLFLDTHPYNAGTTASDALKMGLPVLTMIGNSFNSREGASILNSINLPELITTSLEDYEVLAIELAKNPEKLNKIKEKLLSNLVTAPLFDTPLFTKNLESAYSLMYERYHKGLDPNHIYVES
jgi:protein O-GlcNAc transferase